VASPSNNNSNSLRGSQQVLSGPTLWLLNFHPDSLGCWGKAKKRTKGQRHSRRRE